MPPSTTDTLNRTIAPKDTMYVPAQAEEYFWVGRSALSCVELAVQAAGKKPSDIQSVLDFPCGHGRVLRHLKLAYPNAEFTVCDLDRDGVDFCASTFSATGVYSHVDPDKIPLRPASFDLIWVGSLLTHFDAPRWVPFLRSLSSWLRPGGILAFSVHGRTTHAWMENKVYDYALPAPVMADVISQYRKTGFGYVKYVG